MKVRALAGGCAIALATFAGCSLFVSVDGLANGDGDGGADSGTDAAIEAASIDPVDGASTPEAGTDSGPFDAGSWSFVASDAKTSATVPIAVTSSASINIGDLVVVGCDTAKNGGPITLSGFPTTSLALQSAGPFDDGVAYEAQVSWGIVTGPLASPFNVQATTTSSVSFIDCTVNVYRGGASGVEAVEVSKTTGPNDSGLVSCGPIATAPGGLAYYIAARTSCAGVPVDPAFTQRTGINGNPNGDSVPTTGAPVQTQLQACNGSTSAWICLMVSLSP